MIKPYSPKGDSRGRPPIGMERMLRLYIAQQCFGLSDEGAEDAIYKPKPSAASMALISRKAAPDATTLLKFRRLWEEKQLTAAIFDTINAHLADKGLALPTGTIVDATLIAAPSSTKNQDRRLDPDMVSGDESEPRTTKKGKH